jgi:hypothetical protein
MPKWKYFTWDFSEMCGALEIRERFHLWKYVKNELLQMCKSSSLSHLINFSEKIA